MSGDPAETKQIEDVKKGLKELYIAKSFRGDCGHCGLDSHLRKHCPFRHLPKSPAVREKKILARKLKKMCKTFAKIEC